MSTVATGTSIQSNESKRSLLWVLRLNLLNLLAQLLEAHRSGQARALLRAARGGRARAGRGDNAAGTAVQPS